MDKTDNTLVGNSASGIMPMAKIDGGKIRRLRESLGLTQLYLATFIGVTTDTISRWENRRYPAIKLDNAEKLAQALEVELEAILDQEDVEEGPGIAAPLGGDVDASPLIEPAPQVIEPAITATLIGSPRRFFSWLAVIFFIAALGVFFWWKKAPAPPSMVVSAERILPTHVPEGQVFPVLIRVKTNQQSSVSLIVKETIPTGCRVVGSEPSLASIDAKSGVLKWISRIDKQEATFAYQLQTSAKEMGDGQLRFSGGVTLNYGDQVQADIVGNVVMTTAPYHWADVDRNNTIDDEEILAVYDRYSVLMEMDFDRDLIDTIWTANGYLWNRKTGKYLVRQEK